MKQLKKYKGVAVFYLVLTIIGIFWISFVDDVNNNKQVNNTNDKQVVINYKK